MNTNFFRPVFRLTVALVTVLALGAFLAACPVNSDDDKDSVSKTTPDQTVFVGNFEGVEFINDFRARFPKRANEVTSATKIVVLDGSYSTSGSAIPAITTAYNEGAAIVLVKPSSSQQAALTAAIQHKSALYQTGEEPIDMYAFNKFDEHHILMTELLLGYPADDTVTTITVDYDNAGAITGTTENTETKTNIHQEQNPIVNWAAFLDAMVEWLDAHNNGEALRASRAAADDVANLMNAQKFTITASGACGYTLANTNIGCNTIAVTDQYYVWAIYDKTNHEDYYIVREDISIPSGSLGYRENYDSGNHYRNTGFYLNTFRSNHIPQSPTGTALSLNSGVFLVSSSPATANNSQTVTTGTSFSLSGSLGFNGLAGTGSAGGSVSYSNSVSQTITDFGLTNNAYSNGTANTDWSYHIQNEPEVSAPPWNHSRTPRVGKAPDIAKSTATFTNEWVWRIPTAAGSTDSYKMQVQGSSWYAFTWAHSDAPWSCEYGAAESGANFDQTFILTPPPRD
jgi:hypothetical protein